MNKVFTPKLITVMVVTLLCLYLIYPTVQYFALVTTMPEEPTAEQEARRHELLANPNVIKLGLDLQGGADFLLEVDRDRTLRRLVENEVARLREQLTRDDVNASVRMVEQEAGGFVVEMRLNDERDLEFGIESLETLIQGQFALVPEGNAREALASEAGLLLIPDEAEVTRQIRDATDGALEVVRRRVDAFGLTQPIVARAGIDRINVQVPGEDDPESLRESLLKTAALEFRLLHPEHDTAILEFIQGESPRSFVEGAGTGRIKPEHVEVTTLADGRELLRLKDNIPGVPAGYTLRLGTHKVVDEASGAIDEASTIDDLVYLVQQNAPVTGDQLRRAAVITDPRDFTDPIKVSIQFDRQGTRAFGEITADNVGRRFAILLDDVVYSAPTIQDEILGGAATISGSFTQAEASDLATILKAGALPAPLIPITENTVGPSLGADSIRDSVKAIGIGAVLIVILMVAVYGASGFISVIAMLLNVLLIMAVLSLMGATLTLSGIGGILLTMGIAVDANILIYERLREELNAGKPLRAAINVAFNRAFTVIVDSNVTSLLPALVLVLFEVVDGSVKGFWTAIAIGLFANLYTAIVVTRALMEAWYTQFKSISVGKFQIFRNATIDWMRYRVVGLAISGSLTIASVGYLAVYGPSFGIDFTGGVQSVVTLPTATTQGEIVSTLDQEFKDVRAIKVVNQPGQWQITVPQLPDDVTGVTPTLDEIRTTVVSSLNNAYEGSVVIENVQSIDPAVGDEFKTTAFWTVLVVCAVILSYVAFRFQWVFGAAAILALLHDVFLAFGLFKMFGHTLTLDIVSALLIILGYSVNDTIVVFDRVRERMQDRLTADLSEVINKAINEVLNRTVLTSGSTFLVVGVMYLFGGSGLSDFALILLLGIVFGTYSSIFVASATVYTYLKYRGITTVIAAKKATTRVAVRRSVPTKT